MKRFLVVLVLLLAFLAISFYPRAQSQMKMPAREQPAALMAGLGNLHHAVRTQNPLAQKFFDQGLRLVYAFNHEEAVRAFRRAAELDPQMAMAYWGAAYALGPNINQGKAYAAASVQAEFQRAWRNADTALRVQDL